MIATAADLYKVKKPIEVYLLHFLSFARLSIMAETLIWVLVNTHDRLLRLAVVPIVAVVELMCAVGSIIMDVCSYVILWHLENMSSSAIKAILISVGACIAYATVELPASTSSTSPCLREFARLAALPDGSVVAPSPPPPIPVHPPRRKRTKRHSVRSAPPAESCDTGVCCICMAKPKNMLFIACAHLCVCEECATAITSGGASLCPLCRTPSSVMKVYV